MWPPPHDSSEKERVEARAGGTLSHSQDHQQKDHKFESDCTDSVCLANAHPPGATCVESDSNKTFQGERFIALGCDNKETRKVKPPHQPFDKSEDGTIKKFVDSNY